MKFAGAKTLVRDGQERGHGVPAFNTNGASYDITRAALEAAQELRSPIILQVYEPNCAYRGFDCFVNVARFLCNDLNITVPVALQLDHGKSFDSVVAAMRAGFTDVMFDASHDPLDQNIAKTRQVVQVAKALEIGVEAEVGYVKGNEPPPQKQIGRFTVPARPTAPPAKTDIEEARRFVQEVQVDMLAVSVGTTHGVYQRQTEIDFDLLKQLRGALSVPLVQHGTSGISNDDLSKLVQCGMVKVNFGEPFRFNYINYFCELADGMEHLWHSWKIMHEVKNRLREDMKQLILALGSDGQAP